MKEFIKSIFTSQSIILEFTLIIFGVTTLFVLGVMNFEQASGWIVPLGGVIIVVCGIAFIHVFLKNRK